MKKLSDESKHDIAAVYQELYCIPTIISEQGVAVAEHLENYLGNE
jgi:hypothetical protein